MRVATPKDRCLARSGQCPLSTPSCPCGLRPLFFRPIADIGVFVVRDHLCCQAVRMDVDPEVRAGAGGDRADANPKASGVGCAIAVLGINALIFGLLAMTFTQGPYSSWEQELWYRYGSIGLFLGGAILPGIILFGGGRRRVVIRSLTVWMSIALFVGLGFIMLSGGGI